MGAALLSAALLIGGAAVVTCGAGAKSWIDQSSLLVINESFYEMSSFVLNTLNDIERTTLNRSETFVVIKPCTYVVHSNEVMSLAVCFRRQNSLSPFQLRNLAK